jgi:TPR repeat protein
MSDEDRDIRAAQNAILRRDASTAFDIYARLAEEGKASGQHCLAWCYEQGVGTDVNLKEAFRLWSLAAKQGYSPAIFAIAGCYETGQGTELDALRAYCWYRVAEILKYEGASEKVRELREGMTAEALAEAESIIGAA